MIPPTVNKPEFVPDIAIAVTFKSPTPPEFSIVKVRTKFEPTSILSKSVWSAVVGVASPSAMVTEFPVTLISGEIIFMV